MEIVRLFISPGHNFFGHDRRQAGAHPTVEVNAVECVAGHGLRGDRFFDFKDNYKGQVTFFAEETFYDLCNLFKINIPAEKCHLSSDTFSPGVFRRNVITRGVDLNSLIGREFTVQGVRFEGVAECTPCHWMDQAFHPGAHEALKGRGGLRARILNDGWLHAGQPAAALSKPAHG